MQLAWAVINAERIVLRLTVKGTRSEAIKAWLAFWTKASRKNWRHWRRRGYRCVRIELRIVGWM